MIKMEDLVKEGHNYGICRMCDELHRTVALWEKMRGGDETLGEQSLKRCCTCKEVLPFSDFLNDKYTKDGLRKLCIKCTYKEKNILLTQIIYHYTDGSMGCKCGWNDVRTLTIDHINNDGNKQRKIHGCGVKFYRWIIDNNYPQDLQILCRYCQSIKARAQKRLTHSLKKINIYHRKRATRLRLKVITNYSHNTMKCEECERDNLDGLEIDHIKHNGAEERRKYGIGACFYLKLIKEGFPEEYRILCSDHNWIAHLEFMEAKRNKINNFSQGHILHKVYIIGGLYITYVSCG